MTVQIFDFEQGSEEWRCGPRLGIPTVSEYKSVLAKGEGKTRRTYLMKLLGERFTGEPSEGYANHHMERGKVMEDDARSLYALLHDVDLTRVGFVRNDDLGCGPTGCSPDSLIGLDGGVEIKTKLPHLQLEVLLAGNLPAEHKPQVQGSLMVTEREWWDFVSYWPRLPLFTVRVYRDEEYIKKLTAELRAFNEELDMLTETLVRNGATRLAA